MLAILRGLEHMVRTLSLALELHTRAGLLGLHAHLSEPIVIPHHLVLVGVHHLLLVGRHL